MTKKIIYSLLLVFGISQFSSAQFGFSHEVGAFVGPVAFQSDFGERRDLTTNAGLVKIFNEAAQINAGNVRYFSENLDQAEKRIKINIRVDSGNIEVIRG